MFPVFSARSGDVCCWGGTPLRALLLAVVLGGGAAQVVTTLAGSGVFGNADGTGTGASFRLPAGLAIDVNGNVLVADADSCAIRSVSPGGVVTTFVGSGTPGSADGTGVAAEFWGPSGVAIYNDGNIAVADSGNNRIRLVTPAGVVTTLAGRTMGLVDGTGTNARFNVPWGVVIVPSSSSVVVADMLNACIRLVTLGGVVTTLAGGGAPPFGGAGSFADGTGTAASFNYPKGVTVDASGNVIVADADNKRVRHVTPGGVVTTLAGSGAAAFADGTGTGASFEGPGGVAIDTSGNVLVTDGHRVRKVTPGGVTSTLAGSGANAFADGIGTAASFTSAFGIAIDISGNIYVSEWSGYRIRVISAASRSETPTMSVTPSVTPSHSGTPSTTTTPSNTGTPSVSPTLSGTPSVTPSVTSTVSGTPSVTPSSSATPSLTASTTFTPTGTPSVAPLSAALTSSPPPSAAIGGAIGGFIAACACALCVRWKIKRKKSALGVEPKPPEAEARAV